MDWGRQVGSSEGISRYARPVSGDLPSCDDLRLIWHRQPLGRQLVLIGYWDLRAGYTVLSPSVLVESVCTLAFSVSK